MRLGRQTASAHKLYTIRMAYFLLTIERTAGAPRVVQQIEGPDDWAPSEIAAKYLRENPGVKVIAAMRLQQTVQPESPHQAAIPPEQRRVKKVAKA
jgi:hypothetical protein